MSEHSQVAAPLVVDDTFDADLWLRAFTQIGGGYAVDADRRLCLLTGGCDVDDLTPVMTQLVGRSDRQQAVRDAIEQARAGGR
jgi:hypothetical protein